MKKKSLKKTLGLVVDFAMYAVMLMQMLYVITGNAVHEWLGIGFFVLLVSHMVIKRRWFRAWMHPRARCFRPADLQIL